MGIDVLYGLGRMKLEKYGTWKKSSVNAFRDYLNVLKDSTKQYDVLINDGRCRPQVAAFAPEEGRNHDCSWGQQSSEVILFCDVFLLFCDCKVRGNEEMKRSYTKADFPSREFNGVAVYRNDRISKTISFPDWW